MRLALLFIGLGIAAALTAACPMPLPAAEDLIFVEAGATDRTLHHADVAADALSGLDRVATDGGTSPDQAVSPPDRGTVDSGPTLDSTGRDLVAPDSTTVDAGARDTGGGADAAAVDHGGPGVDSAMPDAATRDAGPPDSALGDLWAEDDAGCAPPWWEDGAEYAARIPLVISQAEPGYTVVAELTDGEVNVLFDYLLHRNNDDQIDGSDLRMVWWNGSEHRELNRFFWEENGKFYLSFKIQEPAGYPGGDFSYFIYVGWSEARRPPTDSKEIFYYYENFEGMVAQGNNGSSFFEAAVPTQWQVMQFSEDGRMNTVFKVASSAPTSGRLRGLDLRRGSISVLVRFMSPNGSRANKCGPIFWAHQSQDLQQRSGWGGLVSLSTQRVELGRWETAQYSQQLFAVPGELISGRWYQLTTIFNGSDMELRFNRTSQGTRQGDAFGGELGLYCDDAEVFFDNIQVAKWMEQPPSFALGAVEEAGCD